MHIKKILAYQIIMVALMNEFQLHSPTLIDVKDFKKIDFESVMPK